VSEIIIRYPGQSLGFDGATVTVHTLKDDVSIPARQIASIDLPSYLNTKMTVKIRTTDGRVFEFPAAWQRKKLRALRDAVLAAQGGELLR